MHRAERRKGINGYLCIGTVTEDVTLGWKFLEDNGGSLDNAVRSKHERFALRPIYI
ncbi:hypothetical protein M065_3467 [Bacteroides fragilis str. Korea 419]|nr:hypothetical protein M065_3467 [Bacteroides fragilis str. Korea 419]